MQSVFPWAPKVARKCESKQYACGADGWSLGRAGGRSVYGHVITKFLFGWVVYHIFLPMVLRGALRAPELRYEAFQEGKDLVDCFSVGVIT